MNNKAFDSEAIDRYLSGQMKEAEKVRFEVQIVQDAELAQEVELHRDIRNGIDIFELTSLKEKLRASEHPSSGATGPPKAGNGQWLYTWVAAAASLGVVLLLGYLFLQGNVDNQALVAANYQPYPNILSPVDRSSEATRDELKEALYAYENGRYEKAITLFEQNESQLNEGYRFYQALSYFETGRTDRAIQRLDLVIEKQDSLFYFPSLWYQALAYIQTNQVMQAKDNLETLIRNGNSYQSEAKALLEELE